MNTAATKTVSSVHVAVIGGGITGVSAAWYLQSKAQAAGIELTYTLLEQSGRWGGKIRTETVDGFGDRPFIVEAGPDSFITQKPWALQLAQELGMEDRLLGTNDHLRKTFVVNRGKLTPLPDGVLLIVPTRFTPFIFSPLFSPLGKLRMGMELFLPAKADDEDESLADFVRRRLGSEALDKLAEPLMAGIYNTEAERQSLLATFPRFRTLEKKYGSLTRGMLASRGQHAPASTGRAPKYSLFTSFKDGMIELVDGLLDKLTGDLCLDTGVETLTTHADGTYTLALSDETQLAADVVICTTPTGITSTLLKDLAPTAADMLADMRYVSTGTITLAFRRSEIQHPLDGFGAVIPHSERRPINAVTWISTKFNHRAPEGYVLMRVFFGGSRNPQTMKLDDDTLREVVRKELRELMGIEAEPVFDRIYRWWEANPQYDVGHLDLMDRLEAALPENLYVTGSAYRGIGVPDCVHQAQLTVEMILEKLSLRVEG